MSSLYALKDEGHEKVRLPRWNEHAYLDISGDGAWATLYDVLAGIGGGEPIPVSMADCAQHDTWEPVLTTNSEATP